MMSAHGTETGNRPSSPQPVDLCPDQHFRPFASHPAGHIHIHPTLPVTFTVIPNRIFIGGIDSSIVENDLMQYFSEYGQVKDVRILTDRSGSPKGYGFISFETIEDVQKILQNADGVQFKDRTFYIGPAIRKQHRRGRTTGFSERRRSEGRTRSHHPSTPLPHSHHPSTPLPMSPMPVPNGPVYLTTFDGLPYTYYNGVAYFQRPEDIQVPHHWPSSSGTHHAYPPVILNPPPQPDPQQPAYQHYQYMQQYLQYEHSVYLYQDVDQPRASGGWVHPTLPAISEEQTFQVAYQGVHPLPRIKARYGRRFSHYNRGRLAYTPEVSELEEAVE